MPSSQRSSVASTSDEDVSLEQEKSGSGMCVGLIIFVAVVALAGAIAGVVACICCCNQDPGVPVLVKQSDFKNLKADPTVEDVADALKEVGVTVDVKDGKCVVSEISDTKLLKKFDPDGKKGLSNKIAKGWTVEVKKETKELSFQSGGEGSKENDNGKKNTKGQVKKYAGFTEYAERFIFPYEEKYGKMAEKPLLYTVLPSGLVETRSKIESEDEKALISFIYRQRISKENVLKALDDEKAAEDKGALGHVIHYDTRTYDTLEKAVAPAPENKEKDFTLVQTWPTEYTDHWRNSHRYEITKENEKNKKMLSDNIAELREKCRPRAEWRLDREAAIVAATDFRQTINNIFPPSPYVPISYHISGKENTSPVYVGKPEDLFDLMLSTSSEGATMREDLMICTKQQLESSNEKTYAKYIVTSTGHAINKQKLEFLTCGYKPKKKKAVNPKLFKAEKGEDYVFYKKMGNEEMGCVKPLRQFNLDCSLVKPETLLDTHA